MTAKVFEGRQPLMKVVSILTKNGGQQLKVYCSALRLLGSELHRLGEAAGYPGQMLRVQEHAAVYPLDFIGRG